MSSDEFIVVSFYTRNTGYEQEVKERLIPSLERLGVAYDVVGVESKGSWNLNIYQKAYVIRDMLRKHAPKNVVWLDADAELARFPDAFASNEFDFACHFRRGRKLSSGTMFFRNSAATNKLVDHWVQAIETHPEHGVRTEQEILLDILPAHGDLAIGRLPLEYSMIFDGDQVENPVVVHHQASRRFKDAVNSSDQSD